ncbi:HORMA domain containing protein [Tritrichomonas foetus]|uniref:HORMA domain containing protein n=2 Tax=Tritrichomonas TaxID=5723 RepID=A0A1J4KJ15_9EUKA|nr:HORMA domain containing protein [Tritrichomonas foetus]|eukprot:OHT11335.1 HORMA domain containing protein [Tritrichomonas foetus]
MTLVRNILRSSISSIAYLRYLFPEENFADTQLAGLKIKSLIPSSNPEIAAMTEWMENGVFDAIEKHYLKALVFSIFSEFNNPSSLLESYTFKFSYPEDGNISMGMIATAKGQSSKELSYMTREQIQQAWCTLIRTLITLSHTLPPLPQERHVAMRLYYYEDVTPTDYNPPGFTAADDAPNFEFVAEPECVEIGGSVRTKYHAVSLRLDTAMPSFVNSNTENMENGDHSNISDNEESSLESLNEITEKTELAIIAVCENENGTFTKGEIAKKLKLSKSENDDSTIDRIFGRLLDNEIITQVDDDTYQYVSNEANNNRFKHLISKYSKLENEN